MREKTNCECNYNVESNVIDLARAKKIMKSKKTKNKVIKIKNSMLYNKHKTNDLLRSSIYKRILALTFIFIFAYGGIFLWFKMEVSENIFLTRFGIKCTGRVIDTVEDVSLLQRGESLVYRSTIQFKTINGENVEFETGVYRDPYKYNKEAVSVIYSTDNPKMAKIDSFDTLVMPIIVFGVIGITFVLFPICLTYFGYFGYFRKLKILNERKFI